METSNDKDERTGTQKLLNSNHRYLQVFKGKREPTEEKVRNIRKEDQMQFRP